MQRGDLGKALKGHLPEVEWAQRGRSIARGIAKGLQYLHSRDPVIIHRDVRHDSMFHAESCAVETCKRPTL